jgi:hypothetical protein
MFSVFVNIYYYCKSLVDCFELSFVIFLHDECNFSVTDARCLVRNRMVFIYKNKDALASASLFLYIILDLGYFTVNKLPAPRPPTSGK